ncbi:MAG: (2Fe-2S)-binding protein [Rhodospirillaceae bacterium]|nr:(2Fe-2S)-binding protein [Rhodospirillaceae bacterium]
MSSLLSDLDVIDRVFEHIDRNSTDLGEDVWYEPTKNYSCPERFQAEMKLFRHIPLPFCPSAALPKVGDYVARDAAGVPIIAIRGEDGVVRAFRNACRHRGMKMADGHGCAKALVCGYHGWAYKLDGRLDYIPDAHGFPGFDKEKHGLVPVTAAERHGLVFVTQEEPVSDGPLADYPEVLKPHQELVSIREFDFEMNWKLFAEAGMEGYHIKVGHPKTFYPYGFDNLNVVEPFGPNSRVTFPFRRIEKLRDVPREERKIDGKLTYAYQIFPNLLMAKLSRHTTVQFAEPVSPSRTKYTNYYISNDPIDGDAAALAEVKKDIDYVSDTGVAEDRDITMEIQKGLASGANEHFVYGHFEAAIVHFHKVMNELMPKVGWEE